MSPVIIKRAESFMQISRQIFPIVTKVGFFADMFIRITYIKFHRKPPNGRHEFMFGQTDGLHNSLRE